MCAWVCDSLAHALPRSRTRVVRRELALLWMRLKAHVNAAAFKVLHERALRRPVRFIDRREIRLKAAFTRIDIDKVQNCVVVVWWLWLWL